MSAEMPAHLIERCQRCAGLLYADHEQGPGVKTCLTCGRTYWPDLLPFARGDNRGSLAIGQAPKHEEWRARQAHRPISADELMIARHLHEAGESWSAIARKLNRDDTNLKLRVLAEM